MSNSLGPDQVLHYVGPDLGPKSLQWLSIDNTSRLQLLSILRRPFCVVYSLFIVAPIVCVGFVLGFCFVMQ